MEELATRYDASQVEAKWYQAWSQAGLFSPSDPSDKPNFTVTIPPPNITGTLHMGHSLCYPVQDAIGRYKRLRGYNVLILPGQDHAGIAAQSVVDKELKKEGLSAVKLGREAFVQKVWDWQTEYGGRILEQFKQLGCGFDWSRRRYTLDDAYVRAVLHVFIDWFERGLIYRGKRVVNWDPVLQTSVSDIETERKVVRGKLYHIRYPFSDGSGSVTIATTRPETMLADVAVAVHPSDERYRGMIGKSLVLPLTGQEIPLIEDTYPDPEFGTGAVKITPSHDANDFEVGVRHNLPMPIVIDPKGKMTEDCGPYAGLDRIEARKRIVADLEEQGFLEKIDDHEIALITSERSGEVIEPLLSEQWFARQTELAKPALEAVKSGKIRFIPDRYNKVYIDWMENIRDWNISRQLWWGHRIPVYYTEEGTAYAAHSWEEAQSKAGDNKIVRQDDEVLDTWFSSGLWPFATFGWPDDQGQLKERFPTDLLVTDRNIIYLWVARMIMMSLDQIGDIPFPDVVIHATVMTEDGRRMSKSLGTGVDPGKIIAEKGADALRFTLLGQAGHNQEIRYSERKTDDARNFCNKIWNATRFILMNMDGVVDTEPAELAPIDQWLLSRLARAERISKAAYDDYDLQEASQTLYKFFWSELCDWYIEISKPRLANEATRATCQWVLLRALEGFATMMHPIMPHITEEVYAHLPIANKSPFVMSAPWPDVARFENADVETRVERWIEITRSVRALRAEIGLIDLKKTAEGYFEGDLEGGDEVIRTQSALTSLVAGVPAQKHVSITVEGVDIHIPIEGLIDSEKEGQRLQKELEKTQTEHDKLAERLSNPQFVERAKPEIVDRERENLSELASKLAKIQERIRLFSN